MNHRKNEINVKLSCDIKINNEIILLKNAHTSCIIPIKPIFCFIFSPFCMFLINHRQCVFRQTNLTLKIIVAALVFVSL